MQCLPFLQIEEISEAMDTLKYISSDDEVREIADLREKTLSDKNSEMTVAREEGLAEGIERGMQQGLDQGRKEGIEEGIESKTKEAARNMKAEGLSNELIVKCLGISEEELKKILD